MPFKLRLLVFFYYKGWFSIALLAVCDAHYIFTLVDIGLYGSSNDSSILSHFILSIGSF